MPEIVMENETLIPKDLIELHENLNNFAKHHQNLGGQKAHKLIKAMWDESKSMPRHGSNDAILRDEGFDKAFSIILKELHGKFVP